MSRIKNQKKITTETQRAQRKHRGAKRAGKNNRIGRMDRIKSRARSSEASCVRKGPREAGTRMQPAAIYGKEQSLRLGDGAELEFGDEQGGIGSASDAHAVARIEASARPLLKARNSPRDAGVERERNPDVSIFLILSRQI